MSSSQQEIEQARADFRADPEDANLAYNLGLTLFMAVGNDYYAGKPKPGQDAVLAEAGDACRAALDLAPNHGSAMIQLGQILYFQGNKSEAERWLDKGLTIDSRSQTWLAGADFKARICMETGRVREGMPVLEELVKQHPGYEAGKVKLAACLAFVAGEKAQAGDLDGARLELERAFSLDGGSEAALEVQRNIEKALEAQRTGAAQAESDRQNREADARAREEERQRKEREAREQAERSADERAREEKRARREAEKQAALAQVGQAQAKAGDMAAKAQALSAKMQADIAAVMGGSGDMAEKMAKMQAIQAEFAAAMARVQSGG